MNREQQAREKINDQGKNAETGKAAKGEELSQQFRTSPQLRIVAEVERRLSVGDELETTVTANLQRAARLRQAILQQAFGGGLVSVFS